MNLEDHAGDILRKARTHANVTREAAAQAARLPESVFVALEDSGEAPAGLNLAALCAKVGLNAAKFESILRGWLPQPVALDTWRELRTITTHGPAYSVNCFLVWDEVTRDAALFDTGFDANPISAIVDEHGLALRHLFITHTHEDHIAAIGDIRQRFPKIRLHSNSKAAPPEQRNRANDFIHLGSLRITNRETPGHAEDGVTYVIGTWPEDAPHVAIVGDAIFAGSMGKAPGSSDLAKSKVREQILSLPTSTLICPGHGPLTTVGEELAHNPFF